MYGQPHVEARMYNVQTTINHFLLEQLSEKRNTQVLKKKNTLAEARPTRPVFARHPTNALASGFCVLVCLSQLKRWAARSLSSNANILFNVCFV